MKKTKPKSIQTLRFTVEGRTATLEDVYYSEQFKDIFSFPAPGRDYNPGYKQWIRTLKEYKEDPDNADPPSGWNGRISMVKNNTIGIGLLLGSKDKILKAGFKIKITKWRNRPYVDLRKGFRSRDKKYLYQNDAVQAIRASIEETGGGLVIAATGSGKTKIAAQLASGVRGNILFIVDQIDLLYQSQKEISMWLKQEGYSKIKVGVVGNSKFDPGRVTIATIQTLHAHRKKFSFRLWTRKIDLIIIDEIHKIMGSSNFGVVASIKPQAVIGLTATLQMRKKAVAMKAMSIAGPVIYKFPITQGVELGVLSQGVVLQIEVPANQAKPHEKSLQWKYDPRAGRKVETLDKYNHHVVYHTALDEIVASLVQAAMLQEYASAVLVERVDHVRRLSERLARYKPRLFYGAVGKDQRKQNIKRFEKGSAADLIIANKVFTKGINIKRLDLVIDNAQRQNKDDIQQKFGRAVRLHANKQGAIFISLATPAMKKAMDSQKSAFRSARIPVERIRWTDAKTALKTAQKLLRKTLKGNKK